MSPLLKFLQPIEFKDLINFNESFGLDDYPRAIVKCLRDILQSLMLRRIKAEVDIQLKGKLEFKLFIGLTEIQQKMYYEMVQKGMIVTTQGGKLRKKQISNVVLEFGTTKSSKPSIHDQ